MSAPGKPTFIDLFCGCGGLSLGFTAAGFQCADGIEFDPDAYATHAKNFGSQGQAHSATDIRDVVASDFKSLLADRSPTVIIGGPPCQPFTRVGRAKLREVASLANAHIHDERVTFYEHYLRFLEELQPTAFVMENVPDLCRFNGRNIAEEIAVTAECLGYVVRYALLNAAWYGVPQMRDRVIILGFRSELGIVPSFPARTHRLTLPRGYITSRLASGDVPILPPHDHFAGVPVEAPNALPAVSVREAIGDLPALIDHLAHGKSRCGARKFDKIICYGTEPQSDYQKLMRSWPGLTASAPPADHVIRFTPRDYATFKRMKPGDQYPEAHAIALKRLEAALDKVEKLEGNRPRRGSKRYQKIEAACLPPYDPKKFPNKWQKLDFALPSHTLTAHLGKDTYSHIHPDKNQARMISVREAARLQSFPDAFRFEGSMNKAFKQIGNSVPPLLALALAKSVWSQLAQASIPNDVKSEARHSLQRREVA